MSSELLEVAISAVGMGVLGTPTWGFRRFQRARLAKPWAEFARARGLACLPGAGPEAEFVLRGVVDGVPLDITWVRIEVGETGYHATRLVTRIDPPVSGQLVADRSTIEQGSASGRLTFEELWVVHASDESAEKALAPGLAGR